MKAIKFLLTATALLALAACKPQTSIDTEAGRISGGNGLLTIDANGHPKAQVSAGGDLIIDGKPVKLSPAQRKLVSAYYGELHGIAQAGIAVGKQGAAMAGKAVGAAISGVLSGDTDGIDAKVEAEAKKIEAQAKQICGHLAGLRTAQDALAAQVPAFQPYANLDQKEIDDCGKD